MALEEKSLLQLLIEFLDLVNRYLTEQARSAVEKGIVSPIKKAGIWAAFIILSAILFGIAAIFFAIGLFLLLAKIVGAFWLAFVIIGSFFVILGVVITILRIRFTSST